MDSSRKRTLYVTDLDGTLLNQDSQVSQKSLTIINGLIRRGILFTYATARSFTSASKVTQGLCVEVPVITYNGAFIVNPVTGKTVEREQFKREQLNDIVSVLNRCALSPLVYTIQDGEEKVSWMPSMESEGVRRYLRSRKGDKRFLPALHIQNLYYGDMFYFTSIDVKERLQPAYDLLSGDERFLCTLQKESGYPEYWLEIMPAHATKAKAALKVKKMLKCDRIVSFGDACNDIPLFKVSDAGYAVDNAVPELKEIATDCILGNEMDGVAEWMYANA